MNLEELSPSDDFRDWQFSAENPERISEWVQERQEAGLPLRDGEPADSRRKVSATVWLVCTGSGTHAIERVGEAWGSSTATDTSDKINHWSLHPKRPGKVVRLVDGKPLSPREQKLLEDELYRDEVSDFSVVPEGEELFHRYVSAGKDSYQFACSQCRLDVRISDPWNPASLERAIEISAPLPMLSSEGKPQWVIPVRVLEEQYRIRFPK